MLAGCLIFFVIGMANSLFTAYFLASGGVLWLVFAWLHVLRHERGVAVSRLVGSAHVYAGEPVRVQLALAATPGQPVALVEEPVNNTLAETTSLQWLAEGRGEPLQFADDLRFPRRGHYSFPGLQAQVCDPLGLFRRCLPPGPATDLIVYPKPQPLPHWALYGESTIGPAGSRMDRHSGESGDFYGVRPYQQGDELRHIHWKTTAHTGKLAIKQYHRRSSTATTIYLDCREEAYAERPDALEQAVQAAADAAAHAIGRHSLLRLVQAGAKIKVVPPDRGERQLVKALEVLALAQADGEAPLWQVIAADQAASSGGGTVVAVVAEASTELTHQLLALRARTANVVVVIVAPLDEDKDSEYARLQRALLGAGAAVYRLPPGQSLPTVMGAGTWR